MREDILWLLFLVYNTVYSLLCCCPYIILYIYDLISAIKLTVFYKEASVNIFV